MKRTQSITFTQQKMPTTARLQPNRLGKTFQTKQRAIVLALLYCLLTLSGCGQQPQATQPEPEARGMSVQTATLSQEEQRLLSLIGSSAFIFDYSADDALKSVQVRCYRLDENSQWQAISGGGTYNISGETGRLALQFGNLPDGIRVGLQAANGAVSGSYNTAPQKTALVEGMLWETVKATQQTITYQQELPLIIQYQRPSDEFIAYQIDDFAHPERFTQQGLHQVYALTVCFSRNQLGDNLLPEASDPSEPAKEASAPDTDV